MIEFLKNYTISDNTAFVLFSITVLIDLVYKIFTDLGIVKKGTALYVYGIQAAFYLIITFFYKNTFLRILYVLDCVMTILNFHNDWRINHSSRRKTTVIVPILPDGTISYSLERKQKGKRKKGKIIGVKVLARYDKEQGKYILDETFDIDSDDVTDEMREDILQNIPPKKDGAVPYLWKSNLPKDEEELKRYLLGSEIVQLTYVPCLKRILFKRTKVELQFIGERFGSVVIPYKEFDAFLEEKFKELVSEIKE